MAAHRALFTSVFFLAVAALTAGCAGDSGGLTCGPGTHAEDGVCVLDEGDDGDPGDTWDAIQEVAGPDTATSTDAEPDTATGIDAGSDPDVGLGTDADTGTDAGMLSDSDGFAEETSDSASDADWDASPWEPDSSSDSGSCFNVSGAGSEPWFDLVVVGTQFEAYEGERVRVVASASATLDDRLGVADTEIVDGMFVLSLPEVLNFHYYVSVVVHIDLNADDTCTSDEPLWSTATPIVDQDLLYAIELPLEDCTFCTYWAIYPGYCASTAGGFDMETELPCTP